MLKDVPPCPSHFPPTVWGKIKLDCRAPNNISVQVYDHRSSSCSRIRFWWLIVDKWRIPNYWDSEDQTAKDNRREKKARKYNKHLLSRFKHGMNAHSIISSRIQSAGEHDTSLRKPRFLPLTKAYNLNARHTKSHIQQLQKAKIL